MIRAGTLTLIVVMAVSIAVAVFARPLAGAGVTGSDPIQSAIQSDDPPLPEYITGDECLFCHRFNAGETWQANRHNRTVERAQLNAGPLAVLRRASPGAELADSVEFVLGHSNRVRFLKRGQRYGTLELLSTEFEPERSGPGGTLVNPANPQWDAKRFGAACAGCHATQTDSRTQSFSAVSLDCYVCHGNASLEHANDSRQIALSRRRGDPAEAVVSICGQCHLRGGQSKKTGLPYPNNYIAGDKLFGDYQVEFARADEPKLIPADRHIYYNIREVVERGATEPTCLSCHRVHAGTSDKHKRVAQSEICNICHNDRPASWAHRTYERHSLTCGY